MDEFIIDFNSLTLKHDTGYTIQEVDGLEGLPVRTSQDDLTGDHGGNVWGQLYGMRTINIKGFCWGDTPDEYFDRISALINAFKIVDNTSMLITLWNGSVRKINVKVIKTPDAPKRAAEVTFAEFGLAVIAEDPFFQDEDEQIFTTGLGISGGGDIPTPVPMSLDPSTGDVITIQNVGDVDVYPIFEIFGDVSNPTVTNLTTGESFQINTNITSGNKVTVQRNQQGTTVKYNDVQNYFQFFLGDIFKLVQGTNNIKFTASTFSSSALLRVTYVNKYLAHD